VAFPNFITHAAEDTAAAVGKGTGRQRRRRSEVAGPYRSQSSVPSIRAQATRHEHRRITPAPAPIPPVPGITSPLPRASTSFHRYLAALPPPVEAPQYALQMALQHGVLPTDPRFKAEYGPKVFKAIEDARMRYIAGKENLGEPEDLTNLILLGSGAGELASLGKSIGSLGVRGLAAAGAETVAKQAASTAESTILKRALGGGVIRGAVGRAATKAEPEAVTALRQAFAKKVGAAAAKLPAPVRVAGSAAAKTATLPVRRPFTAPLAAEVPGAIIHGNPSGFVRALEGKGTFATLSNDLAGAVGSVAPGGKFVKQIAEEAVNLPSVVLPSVYLPAAAGVEAARGDPAKLEALWKEWEKTGLLPALVEGKGGAALKALAERPLYSGLEASGALSVAGRGAGALARAATKDHVGGLARPDLTVPGYPNIAQKRGYSRDLIRQGVQRLADRRSGNQIDMTTLRGKRRFEKIAREAADRYQANAEERRRLHRTEALKAASDLLPRKRTLGIFKRLDKASANVVSHAIERIAQHPETFHADLIDYKAKLEKAAAEKLPDGTPALDKAQLKANREMVKQLDAGIKRANPEHVVEAANAFIAAHQPIVQELVDRGLLSADQAAKAAAIPFARVHMGAGYQEGVGVVDRAGNPLSLDQITAEMHKRGIEPAGFLSQRPKQGSGRGDFYQPWYPERGQLPRGARTGEAAATGSYAGGFDAVVRQLVRSHGLLDRVKSWDNFITRFGTEVRGAGVKNMRDAQRVLRDPARYGMDPNVDWVPVRRDPFIAMKSETQAALEHQDPTVAAENFLSQAIHTATAESGPDGPFVFMPRDVVERIAAHFKPMDPSLQRLQAASTAFKRAVLPFSPSFYYGNVIDNTIRTALAGINPAHALIGWNALKGLSKEERHELIGGAHFSSVEKLAAHRSTEALFRGHKRYEVAARAVAEWMSKPGPGTLGRGVGKVSKALMATNSLLTEQLPQYGAVGKLALHEFRATQGSWTKALRYQSQLADEFAKGIRNPDTMIRFQKGIEETYGNWSRMGPSARKFWSNVAPFWTWMRAAYKFAYLTMPAHHPIQTGIITAAARATQKQRESLGLDKMGPEPVPPWLSGGLPIGGGIAPWGKYNSFGYAGNPTEAISRVFLPQFRGAIEALAGRDWKGEEIKGAEDQRFLKAMEELAGSFIPGFNLFTEEGESGHKVLRTPDVNKSFNPLRSYPKSTVDYLREPKQQIKVPVAGSGSSGSAPWKTSGGPSTGTAPWAAEPSSSSGKAPWK
jgi:hypothetical protein